MKGLVDYVICPSLHMYNLRSQSFTVMQCVSVFANKSLSMSPASGANYKLTKCLKIPTTGVQCFCRLRCNSGHVKIMMVKN